MSIMPRASATMIPRGIFGHRSRLELGWVGDLADTATTMEAGMAAVGMVVAAGTTAAAAGMVVTAELSFDWSHGDPAVAFFV